MRLWALDTRHYVVFNETVKCTALHNLEYALQYTADYTPSLHDLRSQVSFQVTSKYPPSMLPSIQPHALDGTLLARVTIRSRESSHDASKYNPSTFWSTLLGILSRTLPIALEGTLPACWTIPSQLCSQATSWYTPSTLPSTPQSPFSSTHPGMLSRTLWSTLDSTLLACLARRSQVHSQEARNSQSHLTICFHLCSRVLNSETC